MLGLEEKVLVTGEDEIGLREKDERERDTKKESSNKEENGNKEKDDEKKPELEKEIKQEERQKDEEPKNLVKLNDITIKLLCPSAKKYGSIYLDTDRLEIVGSNKGNGKIESVKGLNQINGEGSKNIHGMEDGNHKHVNALKMYRIGNGNTGFAITRDGAEKGNFDLKFMVSRNKSNNIEDFAYVDIPLLGSQEKIGLERAIQKSGARSGIRGQGEQDLVQDESDELNEELDVPEDIIDRFNEKMKSQTVITLKQFKKLLCEVVVEKLDEERPNDMPGIHKNNDVPMIVDKMVDQNKGYETAKNDLYGRTNKEKENNKDEYEHSHEHSHDLE